MRKILPWIKLLRPLNFILFLAGVASGAILAGGFFSIFGESAKAIWLTMLSAAMIGGAANAINDYFDFEIDKINRPDRPIPSGAVPRRAAVIIWLVLSGAGILISAWLSMTHFIIASLSVATLFLYSSHLKRAGFWGNVTVAAIIATSLLYGAASLGSIRLAIPGFLFAFLIVLAREIVKDMEDLEGDRKYDAKTLPIILGTRNTSRIAQGILWSIIVLSPLPVMTQSYGGWYMMLIAVLGLCLISVILRLNSAPEEKTTYSGASQGLKAAMMIGIVALCTSGL